MRGDKPKPVEVARLKGAPPSESKALAVVPGGRFDYLETPEPPHTLDGWARDEWDRVAPELAAVGILARTDLGQLEAYCVQMGRARQARAIVERQGILALGSMGQLVEHPAVAIERAALQTARLIAEQYALTPVARARLGLANVQGARLQQEVEATLGRSSRKRRGAS